MKCDCWFHRYHVVHVFRGKIYDHSQGTWDDVFRRLNAEPAEIENYPSSLYEHGMTVEELKAAAKQTEVLEVN